MLPDIVETFNNIVSNPELPKQVFNALAIPVGALLFIGGMYLFSSDTRSFESVENSSQTPNVK